MKRKQKVIIFLLMLLSPALFGNEQFFEKSVTDVTKLKIPNLSITNIYTGASLGWECLYIYDKQTSGAEEYISLCKVGNELYILTNNGAIKEWKKDEGKKFEFVKTLLSQQGSDVTIEGYALTNLKIRQTGYKKADVEAQYKNALSYIPYKTDLAESITAERLYISLVITNENIIKYVISGEIEEKKQEEAESVNTICALSLKCMKQEGMLSNLGNLEKYSCKLKKYIGELSKADYPLYGEYYKNSAEGKNYDKYIEVDSETGKKMAAAAKRYLNWAVEYELGDTVYDIAIFKGVNNTWGKSSNPEARELNYWPKEEEKFPQGENGEGNPIPYVEGGLDTPRTFWKKMSYEKKIIKNIKIKDNSIKEKSTYNKFQPGVGENKFKYAGTDHLGFITGVIAMSGLDTQIKGINGAASAENLNKYSDNVLQVVKWDDDKNVSKELIQNTNSDEVLKKNGIDNPCFSWEDIEFITKVIPDRSSLREGDFLTSYKEGNYIIAVITEIDAWNKKIEAVYMDNDIYGTAKKITIKEEDDFAGRRLLVYDVKQTGKKDVKDVLETLPDNSKSYLEVESVYEQTRDNVNDKWRFIPNTGEYLMLEVRYKLVNKNDVNLLLLNEYELEAEVLAKDRSYDETVSNGQDNGNIYKNKTNQFEIGLHKDINSLPVINYKIYRQDKEEDKKYYAPKKEDVKRISIEKNGRLINSQKEKIKIGIRPISSEQAFPGDDLIIGLKIYDKGTEESSIIWSKEKDYIAVYDKKMLWRANLYIDEGKNDWNNKHPWNVPVNGSSGGPVWWNGDAEKTEDKRWGNNEWNIKADGTSGDGKQIVSIPSTKWCYGYDNKSQHVIKKAVAYDHQGWDSPFSFNEKVESQKKLLNQWYTSDGKKRFKKPVYQWPESCTDLGAYKANLGEELCGSETNLGNLKTLYNNYKNNSSSRWSGELDSLDYKKYIFSKNYGNKTKAPYKDYEGFTASFISNVTKNSGNVTSGNEDAVSIDGKIYYPYVPGLSDSLMTTLSNHPSSEIGKITAGVDCTGFVMSSAGYKGEHYKAMPEASIPSPVYWETTNIPTPIQTAWHSEGNAVKVGDWNTKEDIDYKKDNGELDSKSVYLYFTHLVPGDIVWYEGHIMMVSSITEPDGYDTAGKPYWNDGSGVKVMESVFNNPKTEYNLVGNYSITKRRNLYQLLKIGKSWEIWRQK